MTTNYSNLYDEQEEEDEQHETFQYFDKMPNDLPWNMNDKIKSQEKIAEIEEQNLSEKIKNPDNRSITNYQLKSNIFSFKFVHLFICLQ
ncbi:unnamed protein product [Rotaria socialis]